MQTRFLMTLIEGLGSYLFLKQVLTESIFRITAVPPFPNLRCFPHGRHFKQWTGDDSKALMKVQ